MGGNADQKNAILKGAYYSFLISLVYLLIGCSSIINRGILPTETSSGQQSLLILNESNRSNRVTVWGEKEGQFALIPEKELYLTERELREWPDLDYFSRDYGRWVIQPEEAGEELDFALNDEVDRFIQYFKSDLRGFFSRALSRSGRYLPVMQEILRGNGVPEDLVYLALIESGFQNQAVSPAQAVGPWQFIKATGERYGLVINGWIDERRDPVKATYAASRYLRDLYNLFGSWHLAKAGYNAGEFGIMRAMDKANTNDFWKLAKNGYLRQETKEYVPKFMAAAIIAKNPEKYGFRDVIYDAALKYDEVEVNGAIDLRVVAKVVGSSCDLIKALNPELKKEKTPPNYPGYKLKIPHGTKEKYLANIQTVIASERETAIAQKKHVVKKGESLKSIANKYGVSETEILETNKLRSARLVKAAILIIPAPSTASFTHSLETSVQNSRVQTNTDKETKSTKETKALAVEKNSTERGANPQMAKLAANGANNKIDKSESINSKAPIKYTVKRGDNLFRLADSFGLPVQAVKEANNIKNDRLVVGQVLTIPVKDTRLPGKEDTFQKYASNLSKEKEKPKMESIIYQVKKGDTLWNIAQVYNVEFDKIAEWNNLRSGQDLKPGDRLKIFIVKD